MTAIALATLLVHGLATLVVAVGSAMAAVLPGRR